MQGSSVTFSSDANGVPEPTFSWTKDGSAVTANDRIRLSADNKELSITNVNGTDSGEYRCVATNSVEAVSSDAATLTVHCKKTFTRFLLINPTEKSFSTKLTSFQIFLPLLLSWIIPVTPYMSTVFQQKGLSGAPRT